MGLGLVDLASKTKQEALAGIETAHDLAERRRLAEEQRKALKLLSEKLL